MALFSRALRLLYQRNPFLEAVPWLMLASALRFSGFSSGGPASFVSMALSNLAVFLAFLIAARRMIEWTGGTVQFGNWSLRDQLRLGQQILNRVLILLFGMAGLAALAGFKSYAAPLLLGFDGIAFDQFTFVGMIWSAFLAAMVYLMLIDAEQHAKPALSRAAHTLLGSWRWIAPAILLVAIAHIAISLVQGEVRALIFAMWTSGSAPLPVMNAVYFSFVFGFATLRLWVTLAILTFAVRESYRRRGCGNTPSPIS